MGRFDQVDCRPKISRNADGTAKIPSCQINVLGNAAKHLFPIIPRQIRIIIHQPK